MSILMRMYFNESKNKDWKDGDSPFEEMLCNFFIEYDIKMKIPDDEGYICENYQTFMYTFYELSSRIRQSIEVHSIFNDFMESKGLSEYFDEDEIVDTIWYLTGENGRTSQINIVV